LNVALRRAEEACEGGREQLLAFMANLLEAVGSTCNSVLVYTLPFDVDDPYRDLYSKENQALAVGMGRAESRLPVPAVHVTPIENNEALAVVLRRLFAQLELLPDFVSDDNNQLSPDLSTPSGYS